jgi:hypothetical protein
MLNNQHTNNFDYQPKRKMQYKKKKSPVNAVVPLSSIDHLTARSRNEKT